MANQRNRHGLSRDIPAEVRRTLRREAGFGCVKCGLAFSEYEHIEPEFKDALEHDPTRMAFLCKGCHGEVTAGRASKKSVWAAKASPFCKGNVKSWGRMETGSLYSWIGSLEFVDCHVLLRVGNEDLLQVAPPEEEGAPIRVSATIYDGPDVSLEIEDNAILIGGENWDVEIVGQVLTIRRGPGEPSLVYRFVPTGGIVIERISMDYKGVAVSVDSKRVAIGHAGCEISAVHATFLNCSRCITATGYSIVLGDAPLPSVPVPLLGNFHLNGCGFPQGISVPSGSRLRFANCKIERGIRIESGGILELMGGLIHGTRGTQRNDPCPCGGGLRFKDCHGAL